MPTMTCPNPPGGTVNCPANHDPACIILDGQCHSECFPAGVLRSRSNAFEAALVILHEHSLPQEFASSLADLLYSNQGHAKLSEIGLEVIIQATLGDTSTA